MYKPYRPAYLSAILGLALLLVVSALSLLFFSEKLPYAHHTFTLGVFKKSFPDQNALRIMPLGDSITEGIGSSDDAGYREPLLMRCEASGWDVRFVGSKSNGPGTMPQRDNEGHPGWRTDQLSARIVGWLQATNPQIILLHIGTNDIIQGRTPRLVAANLAYLLKQITTTDPTATVIVAQIIPLGKPLWNVNVELYNGFIPALVRSLDTQGKHVSYIDMYDVVPASDLPDQIHPDTYGYSLMANAWYQALTPLLTHPSPK